jgi:hypothetical protein
MNCDYIIREDNCFLKQCLHLPFMPFYGDVKLQQKLIWMEAKYYKYRMFLQNQLLLKAMCLASFLPFRFCAPFRIFLIRNELVGSVGLFDLCTKLIAEI